ncbi:hypothetical protein ACI6QG_04835 [Roseococcus sp. DSY-14]|uniref:hypothetical protein n=1 Tax=Roseococcus sp. DSY-14 TaxID=3369650 RepID=UPI00387B0B97
MAEPPSLHEFLRVLVQGTHQGMLYRDVGPEWHDAFVAELERRLGAGDLQSVVSDFIRLINECPEAEARVFAKMAGKEMAGFVQPMLALRPAPIACIALGCLPAAAGMLRRAGLRRWAGPLDWMTLPPAAVRDALADDFLALTNPRHLERIPPAQRPDDGPGFLARHARYSAQHGETLFHHRDPTTEDGFAALERAAVRMRESLRGLHAKMLLQVVEEAPGTAAAWAETADLLDRFARGAALVTVAVVEGRPEGPFPEMEMAQQKGPHRLLRMRPLSALAGLGFADPLDEVVLLRGALSTVAG